MVGFLASWWMGIPIGLLVGAADSFTVALGGCFAFRFGRYWSQSRLRSCSVSSVCSTATSRRRMLMSRSIADGLSRMMSPTCGGFFARATCTIRHTLAECLPFLLLGHFILW